MFLIIPSFSQEANEQWPGIYNNESKNYWQKKEKFYEWFNQAESNGISSDSILKSAYYKNFRRFETHQEHKLDKEGTLDSHHREMQNYVLNKNTNKSGSANCFGDNWSFASFSEVPSNSHWAKGMGRVEDLWVNPLNNLHILAASHTSGLWKTTDGGVNWENITDVLGFYIGIGTIAVDPSNTDIIYIGTGVDASATNAAGYGVFKSIDGGNTWMTTSISFTGNQYGTVSKILIDPTNTSIIHVTVLRRYNQIYPNGYYRSTDGLVTHVHQYIYRPFDIALKPSNPLQITIIGEDGIFTSNNGGINLTNHPISILSHPTMNCIGEAKFAVDPNNPKILGLIYKPMTGTCGTADTRRIDFSYDGGASWSFIIVSSDAFKGGFQFSKNDTNIFM